MAKNKRSFLGSLFKVILLASVLGASYGYYKGYRWEDAQVFLEEMMAKYEGRSDSTETKGEPKTDIKPKQPTKEPTIVEKSEPFELLPLPSNPFAAIDARARKCPASAAATIPSLAAYLQEGASTDLEKARAIYTWLTDNVAYDDAAYNSGNYNDYSAPTVLQSKLAVCAGYSNLYQALGEEMGLNIMQISGYAKGYGYQPGTKFTKTTHAWNIIKIDGTWRVFDATWGTGNGSNVKGKLVSKKEFDAYWFNVDPYEAIFSHLPETYSAAKVSPAIDLSTYENLPYVRGSYFEMGFDGKQAYQDALKIGRLKFPETYKLPTHVRVKEAPAYRLLKKGNSYTFKVEAPRAFRVAVVDSKGNWDYMKRIDGLFQIDYIPSEEGGVSVMVKYEGGGSNNWTFLEYEVKAADRKT